MNSRNKTQYEDKEIGAKHGELYAGGIWTATRFRFRCGPVEYVHCDIILRQRHGRVSKAWGSFRYPKTLHSLRWAEAHQSEGIKVRYGGNRNLPTGYDDYCAHSDKCWKRHRETQYK